MTREEFDAIKPDLLEALRKHSILESSEMTEFLAELVRGGLLSEDQAEHVVWRLFNDGDLGLTRDRKFRVAVHQS